MRKANDRPSLSEASATPQAPSASVSPTAALRLAVAFGLLSGWLELVSFVVKCRWVEHRYYHMSRHFVWMVPLSGIVLFAILGALTALVAYLGPKRVTLRAIVGGYAFVFYLSLLLRWPVYTAACLLLAAGLAVQTARWLGARPRCLEVATRGVLFALGCLWLAVFAGSTIRFDSPEPTDVRRAATLAIGASASNVRSPQTRTRLRTPNVLFIVLDTVRAQNLSLYGYARETFPCLTQLARRGITFERAIAPAPWTTPSHASLFTGHWPHELRVGWNQPLGSEWPTLAEALSERGYRTCGFVANTYYCSYETGLARGFVHYEDYEVSLRSVLLCSSILQRSLAAARNRLGLWGVFDDMRNPHVHFKNAARVNRDFLAWLDQSQNAGPFFAFLNFYDAHHPYLTPPGWNKHFGRRPQSRADYLLLARWWELDKRALTPDMQALARDAYDDCIAYLDHELGALFDALEKRDALDNTIVIVTSDHGEHLGEHSLYGHGVSLYEPELHVPLVIVPPAGGPRGARIADCVSLRDLPATVLDLLGNTEASVFPGRSLARFWSHANGAVRHDDSYDEPALSDLAEAPEADPNRGRSPAGRGPMRSLIDNRFQYIVNGDGREELYDLVTDPAEQHDAAGAPASAAVLEQYRETMRKMVNESKGHPSSSNANNRD